MNGATLGSLLDFILIAAIALTAAKLLWTGLHKHYPVFFLYLLFRIPLRIVPLVVNVRSHAYFTIWTYGEAITLIFYVLLVVELYRVVLVRYRGLQTVGRWAMYVCVVISGTISILLSLPKINGSLQRAGKIFNTFIVAERGIDTALALFILLILLFLSRYPITLSWNARVHALVYSVFFMSNTVALLMRTLFGLSVAPQVNTILTVIGIGSVIAWLILLSPAGEEVRVSQRKMEPEQEKRLLIQLDLVNTTLLRVSRQKTR